MQPKQGAAASGDINRRVFLQGTAAGAAALAAGDRKPFSPQNPDQAAVVAQIAKRHDVTVKRLQDWIALPSIAAEDRNYPEGAEYLAALARDAGCQHVELIPTTGKPGVFATLDSGAPNWLAVYFMYDVKQFDPTEWTSPPLEARIVEKPGLGKAIVGRGAVNQKGPQAALLAALHAIRGAGRKMPVNLVLVAEGEEEIGSPNLEPFIEGHTRLLACDAVVVSHATDSFRLAVTTRPAGVHILDLARLFKQLPDDDNYQGIAW